MSNLSFEQTFGTLSDPPDLEQLISRVVRDYVHILMELKAFEKIYSTVCQLIDETPAVLLKELLDSLPDTEKLLQKLQILSQLCSQHLAQDKQAFYHLREPHPSQLVSIRGLISTAGVDQDTNYTIGMMDPHAPDVLEEIQQDGDLLKCFESTIFLHQGRSLLVIRLDHLRRSVSFRNTLVHFLTQPILHTTLLPHQVLRDSPILPNSSNIVYGKYSKWSPASSSLSAPAQYNLVPKLSLSKPQDPPTAPPNSSLRTVSDTPPLAHLTYLPANYTEKFKAHNSKPTHFEVVALEWWFSPSHAHMKPSSAHGVWGEAAARTIETGDLRMLESFQMPPPMQSWAWNCHLISLKRIPVPPYELQLSTPLHHHHNQAISCPLDLEPDHIETIDKILKCSRSTATSQRQRLTNNPTSSNINDRRF
ncbi:uncharacterized protein VP01_457g6 [Puccinia sorghi]|uniref:Uncharacterized protein n=1 Tax=Puccinia sorghi TaxID=27349 RepID=A0A0L6UPF0_9BASI|nr:uncharacterized protein VP01_457g6 [Puccinia sorghi]